jgi:apolipoprotein D and lipocalin family protein
MQKKIQMLKIFLIALFTLSAVCASWHPFPIQKNEEWNPVILSNISLEAIIAKGPYYSIASKPIFIEKFCKCSMVTFSWREQGHTLNLNESCHIFGHRVDSVSEGIPIDETNARWRNVQWGLISAPYYILEAAHDYSYLVVGSSQKYLWLLSRTLQFDPALANLIFKRQLALNKYDISDVEMTDQSCFRGHRVGGTWDPEVASSVSLETLISNGPYYAIASKPIFIEKLCSCTMVTYSWKDKGQSLNLNESCVIFGHRIESVSEGKPIDSTGARWENIQAGIIKAPYYLLDVAPDYSYIVVGSTNKYLWLLSKTPKFDDAKAAKIFAKQVKINGYDISDVEKTDQSCFETSN